MPSNEAVKEGTGPDALLRAIVCGAAILIGAAPAFASPCDDLSANIKKERNLIKQKQRLESAIRVCPGSESIYFGYAYALERLRKYEPALTYYQKVDELSNGTSDKALFGMGDVLVFLGRFDEAVKVYERGLSIDGGNYRAQKSLNLARIKLRAQIGEDITTEEFTEVMEESTSTGPGRNTAAGPVLAMQIHFRSNSTDLTEEAKAKIDIVGQALQSEPLRETRFEIIGHTDNIGDPETNTIFSKARAETVRDYLVHRYGVTPGRLQISFFGDSKPLLPNTSKAKRAINRRVEFKKVD